MGRINKRQSSAINKRRKGKLAIILPWAKRFGGVLAGIIIVVWVTVWFVMSGTYARSMAWAENQSHLMLSNIGFNVETITVTGVKNANKDTVLALINTQNGDPLFAADPTDAATKIQSLEWIETARVQRKWPNKILITLIERKPMIFKQDGNNLILLDQNAKPIQTSHLTKFKDLPMVSGGNCDQHIAKFLGELNTYDNVFSRLDHAKWIGERRWDMVLKNGVTVKLPEDNAERQAAFQTLSSEQNNNQILDKDIVHIDLRDHTRMIVRTKRGSVREYKANLKTGESI